MTCCLLDFSDIHLDPALLELSSCLVVVVSSVQRYITYKSHAFPSINSISQFFYAVKAALINTVIFTISLKKNMWHKFDMNINIIE